jgi:hypothetical protein
VTQPTFYPVPELARPPKPGLQRSASRLSGAGHGTPAPGEGFALTIAQREVAKLKFAHEHDRHDVETGVALVAAKRASLVGRGPILSDVQTALDIFGLRDAPVVDHELCVGFAGLAHSYAAQRRFVDAVTDEQLVPTISSL